MRPHKSLDGLIVFVVCIIYCTFCYYVCVLCDFGFKIYTKFTFFCSFNEIDATWLLGKGGEVGM